MCNYYSKENLICQILSLEEIQVFISIKIFNLSAFTKNFFPYLF